MECAYSVPIRAGNKSFRLSFSALIFLQYENEGDRAVLMEGCKVKLKICFILLSSMSREGTCLYEEIFLEKLREFVN
jgi:hypothetical protein